ncbi:hypothetical protein VTO42DRAFT_454 [Malbranchea cinnamomea]
MDGYSETSVADRSKRNGDVLAFVQPLKLEDGTLYELAYRFSKAYKDVAANSLEQFFPTGVTRLPTGKETGNYLAAYVGLYYLRVAFIDLLGESVPPGDPKRQNVRRTLEKAWRIEERLKRDNAKDLFAWIGDCVAEVVADNLDRLGDSPPELEMGISFCFPMKQKSINEAILMPTGKGFALASDLDLRQALLDGYERHTRRPDDELDPTPAKRHKGHALPKLRIAAITNDTVATLASLAYSVKSLPNTRVVMGLIVGAGCNSTIPMKLDDLHESKVRHIRTHNPSAVETLVSTEWTLNASSLPLKECGIITKWDKHLDEHCDRPGFQPLEYMVGGRYIGELVRIITCDFFTSELNISRDALPQNLVKQNGLTTDFLSLVVAGPRPSDESLVVELSQKFPPPSPSQWKWTPESASILRTIASAVQTRSAALVAAATVGLLACAGEIRLTEPENLGSRPRRIGETQLLENGKPAIPHQSNWLRGPEELVVAFSGGVIQHYPGYKNNVQKFIDRILLHGGPQDGGKSIFLREVSDGGIVGVGVLAGTAAGKIERIIGV